MPEPAYAIVEMLCDPAKLKELEAIPNLRIEVRPEYTADPAVIRVYAYADAGGPGRGAGAGRYRDGAEIRRGLPQADRRCRSRLPPQNQSVLMPYLTAAEIEEAMTQLAEPPVGPAPHICTKTTLPNPTVSEGIGPTTYSYLKIANGSGSDRVTVLV